MIRYEGGTDCSHHHRPVLDEEEEDKVFFKETFFKFLFMKDLKG